MGDPRRLKKQMESPRKKWDRERLEKERQLKDLYGLKNKKEIRKTETILRKKRQNARNLLPLPQEERQKRQAELLNSLDRIGVLKKDSSLDDVLGLSIEELMERRLQTIVWRKNLAKTIKQARQIITHGHIGIHGKKVNCPGYLVRNDEEETVAYFGKPIVIVVKKKEEEEQKAEEKNKDKEEKGKTPEDGAAKGKGKEKTGE